MITGLDYADSRNPETINITGGQKMKKLYPMLIAGVAGAALVLGGCAGSSVTGELPAVAEITPAPENSDTAGAGTTNTEATDTAEFEETETPKTDSMH